MTDIAHLYDDNIDSAGIPMKVRKAIIPAVRLSAYLLPATKAQLKRNVAYR